MATFSAVDFGKKLVRSMVTGNGFHESYTYTFLGTETAASVIQFGIIPPGVQVSGCKATFDANTASMTIKLGYTPLVTADGPSVNDAYFWAATACVTAGAITSTAHPVTFDYPVILIGTTAGSTATAAAVMDITISGKIVGLK